MNDRIKILVDKTVKGEMRVECTKTEYDRTDLFLTGVKMSGKRVCEYIDNQELLILEESCFTGTLSFDGSVEGDIFTRTGHKNFVMALQNFYNKPVDNLLIFEWQHSVGDFAKIINLGLTGIKEKIEKSKEVHKDDISALEFLETQTDICNTIIKRACKASVKALEISERTKSKEYRNNLVLLSESLKKVPEKPAESFYEAVLSLYFVYPYIPDSIGLIDRYLYPFYKKDIESGKLKREKAKEYLQELFLMLQARISIASDRFYRGGESHFCIGGYLENGEDGFNDLSKLIVEALMELPIWIPQISLRWTKKTPIEVLRYMLDCERKDNNKRIAFVNDEPRIKGLMDYTGISYEEAVNYTMMGCNELALPGGMVFGFDPMNIVHPVESTFHKRSEDIIKAKNFDEFYSIFEKELFSDLWAAEKIGKGLQEIRSRDCNIVSNIFLEGCIENAKSCTQGGLTRYIAVGLPIGISNVIDSLSITKQFVFDEKIVSMERLVDALKNNWCGYDELRRLILKKGNFFGNDDDCSNEMAVRFTQSLGKWNNDDNYLKKKWVFGNLIGYNEHNKFFGNATKATPDGRMDGDITNFGLGQTQGKDRKGITSLLNSVAKCDPEAILTGPSVTNILLDEKLIKDDCNFEKLVYVFKTYFENGGTHFQLTYVSKEDLINAKKTPEDYKNLRVRVSGFSDYFNFLNDALQDEIIERTQKNS
ncbi:MAG: pyruvate formate lyase family protein [Acutalibacteraceae bacterium]|nr:pyruvate formate lyase family protein [Acutalibacteraceae bacterium]